MENILKTLNKLKETLVSDQNIQRFKHLEQLIDHDEKLTNMYKKLKVTQKKMVNAEYKKSANLSQLKEEYNTRLDEVKNHVLLSEYLDLLESINDDLQMIQEIITKEINMDID